MEFSRQEYWSELPFPSPGESSRPRDRTRVSRIAGRCFTIWATSDLSSCTWSINKCTRQDSVCVTPAHPLFFPSEALGMRACPHVASSEASQVLLAFPVSWFSYAAFRLRLRDKHPTWETELSTKLGKQDPGVSENRTLWGPRQWPGQF